MKFMKDFAVGLKTKLYSCLKDNNDENKRNKKDCHKKKPQI